MTEPIFGLVNEMDENYDNFPNITRSDTYQIVAALVVLSARLSECPDNMLDTLQIKPSHLSDIAKMTRHAKKKTVVSNYTLTTEDLDMLKPSEWVNDNASTVFR